MLKSFILITLATITFAGEAPKKPSVIDVETFVNEANLHDLCIQDNIRCDVGYVVCRWFTGKKSDHLNKSAFLPSMLEIVSRKIDRL